jgi:predicted RNA-binding protein associated with RNAse of E/G family
MEIISGHYGEPGLASGYRAELLGNTLVERIVWGEVASPRTQWGETIAGTGYIWFRFWLAGQGQVVERYYDREGAPVGALVHICTPITCDDAGCRTQDLMLKIWLARDGRVIVHGEEAFEQAVRSGALAPSEAASAERQMRTLTAAIARDRFPPPLVRNWQPDLGRIAASLADR